LAKQTIDNFIDAVALHRLPLASDFVEDDGREKEQNPV